MKYTKRQRTDIVIIGGGAAGMMSAITAAELGAGVMLIERNDRLGIKLRITGKGRCNLTNNCDTDTIQRNVIRNGRFLYSALKAFGSEDTMRFFEKLNVPLKTERGNRVFPVSDKASDVADALVSRISELGVSVKKGRVTGITAANGMIEGVNTDNESIECRAAIICTGGVSYPKTGSTGDGCHLAKSVGHTVMPLRGSLVPLESEDEFCAQMQGLSLKNVGLSLWGSKSGKVFQDLGEMQFTHFGLSGPMVLSCSAHMNRESQENYQVRLDLKPALDDKKFDLRLLGDFEKYRNKDFSNALGDLAAKLMIPVLIRRSGIPPDTKVNSITKKQRAELVRLFKAFTIEIKGPRPVDEAVITSGGVNIKEIKPATMESKLVKGLYFAGEILDVDAYTGGFNLQIAWSSGRAAGKAAAAAIRG
ncbi:MAG: NAD(P)/FAD-dependent oxidoreductase [Clostridiales bacterium]|nr:NAD(P)/FAD-dependent oxidoreductase [Clostridiales bacterium]